MSAPDIPPPPPPPRSDPPVNDDHAVMVFVLGIVSLTACQVLGPVAWFLGASYRRRCADEGQEPSTLGTVGMALGIASTAVLILAMLTFIGLCGIYALVIGVAVVGAVLGA